MLQLAIIMDLVQKCLQDISDSVINPYFHLHACLHPRLGRLRSRKLLFGIFTSLFHHGGSCDSSVITKAHGTTGGLARALVKHEGKYCLEQPTRSSFLESFLDFRP